MILNRRRAFIAALAVLLPSPAASATGASPGSRRHRASAAAALAAAKSWGYQLQRIKPEVLAAIPYDRLRLDYSRDGTDARR